ncbi:MAG TPA: energy transducer TonB [Candidatus Competibacteraceae bacterium]|nr:energy transducer TonB [Candidatus Competibacteraceae bacterium]
MRSGHPPPPTAPRRIPAVLLRDPHQTRRLTLATLLALALHLTLILAIGLGLPDVKLREPLPSLTIDLVAQPGGDPAADDTAQDVPPAPAAAPAAAEPALAVVETSEQVAPPTPEALEAPAALPEPAVAESAPNPALPEHAPPMPVTPPERPTPEERLVTRVTPEPAAPPAPATPAKPVAAPKPSAAKPAAAAQSPSETTAPKTATAKDRPKAADLISSGLQLAQQDELLTPHSGGRREKRLNWKSLTTLEEFYLQAWLRKVERVGELNFPEAALGRPAVRCPVLEVALRADGSVASLRVTRPCQDPALTQAALRIVELAAPFAPFPPEMRRNYDVLRFERLWVFESGRFTAGN